MSDTTRQPVKSTNAPAAARPARTLASPARELKPPVSSRVQPESRAGGAPPAVAQGAGHDFGQVSVNPPARGASGLPDSMRETDARAHSRSMSESDGAREKAPPEVTETARFGGQPLDAPTRGFMESRFGHDFSHVRIHTDARADEAAQSVSAHAYTLGSDVVFRSGHYRPDTDAGRKTLAHELAHVVQQGGGGAGAKGAAPRGGGDLSAAEVSRPGEAGEREAARASEAVAGGSFAPPLQGAPRASAPSVQREPDPLDKFHPAVTIPLGSGGSKKRPDNLPPAPATPFKPKQDLIGQNLEKAQEQQMLTNYLVAQQTRMGLLPAKSGQGDASLDKQRAGKADADKPARQPSGQAAGDEKDSWAEIYGEHNARTQSFDDYKKGWGEVKGTVEEGGRGIPAAPEISMDLLRKIYPDMAKDADDPALQKSADTANKAKRYLDSLNEAFKIMKIDTVEAQANYLSHAFVESDQFRQFTETQGSTSAPGGGSQKWQDDPKKVQRNMSYLKDTYVPNEKDSPDDVKRKLAVNPSGASGDFEFIGRGPVQVTDKFNYAEVVAVIEIAGEQYEKEAAALEAAKKDNTQAKQFAKLAKQAAHDIKADPTAAAKPEYAFLVSAAHMKRRHSDRTVGWATPGATWEGDDAGSSWVAGAKQTQAPQLKALKDKSDAYARIYPLLLEEAVQKNPAAKTKLESKEGTQASLYLKNWRAASKKAEEAKAKAKARKTAE
ncbi:MAG TPA: DUF4157 domain-containing protein [Pyrinomonadaceae bacterium]|nr:DUF4157 domain-containing protein [Pyrinomonadaceae bacterium]